MQCPKCGLENMPGTTHCFQCHSDLLVTESAPAGMYPPRAERRGIEEGLKRERPDPRRRRVIAPPSVLAVFGPYLTRFGLASLLPGLGQYLNGERQKAKYFFIATASILVFHAALFFTPLSDLLAYLTVGLLAYSMLDAIMVAYTKETKTRVRDHFGILGAMGLCVASVLLSLYVLFSSTFNLFFLRGVIPNNMVDFSAGDTIIARRISDQDLNPRRGEFLLGRRGASLEWIIGLPGETVTGEKGSLFVDGNLISLPGNLPSVPEGLKLQVPPGFYFTLQSLFLHRRVHGLDEAMIRTTYLTVPKASLMGRVVAVMGPPARRRIVRSHS